MRRLVGWWLDGYFLVCAITESWGKAIDRALDCWDDD